MYSCTPAGSNPETLSKSASNGSLGHPDIAETSWEIVGARGQSGGPTRHLQGVQDKTLTFDKQLAQTATTISSWTSVRTRQFLDIFLICPAPNNIVHNRYPYFGGLWMWLRPMWLQFEVVRGPVGAVWDRFGAGVWCRLARPPLSGSATIERDVFVAAELKGPEHFSRSGR